MRGDPVRLRAAPTAACVSRAVKKGFAAASRDVDVWRWQRLPGCSGKGGLISGAVTIRLENRASRFEQASFDHTLECEDRQNPSTIHGVGPWPEEKMPDRTSKADEKLEPNRRQQPQAPPGTRRLTRHPTCTASPPPSVISFPSAKQNLLPAQATSEPARQTTPQSQKTAANQP